MIPILQGALSELLGGVALGLVIFVLSDYLFRTPNFAGAWTLDITVTDTAYNPFKGMRLVYLVMLWQDGTTIHGTGEKVLERRPDGSKHEYVGGNRVRITVSGGVQRRVVGQHAITMHIVEVGAVRESSAIHSLRHSPKSGAMIGTCFSTAANSHGRSEWRPGIEDYAFEWSLPKDVE